MSLSQSVSATADALELALNACSVDTDTVFQTPVESDAFDELKHILGLVLQETLPTLEPDASAKSRDLVVAVAFQTVADRYTEEYISQSPSNSNDNSYDTATDTVDVDVDAECGPQSIGLNSHELTYFNRLFVLLDAFAHIIQDPYSGAKSSFYVCISNILDLLLSFSPRAVSLFWYYMETRSVLLQEKVFDASTVSDRIALLELTNRVTDKYYIAKKKDSYQKDSFNDKLDARIRMFVTNMFLFEDNTGLNKYFSISNRVVHESMPTGKYKSTDSFLRGAIQLQKLFNDPYYFLKPANHRTLREYVDVMRDVVEHLLQQEISENRSRNTKGSSDHYSLVLLEKSEAEKETLKAKYESVNYFPELYWISPFEELRGAHYDEVKAKDLEFWSNQFKDPKFRRTYLLQIYIVSGMLVELTATNKKELLKSINAPSNIKHITEDSTFDAYVTSIIRIRKRFRDVMKQCDDKFFFLLQHLAANELYWWGWLIYNKTPEGKPFFSESKLNKKDTDAIEEKFKAAYPFKQKRYFNLYATPQLSRKMKIETGLELLKKDTLPDIDMLKSRLSSLQDKISQTEDVQQLEQLKEQQSLLRWKILKVERTYGWLDFGKTIDRLQFIGADNDDEDDNDQEPARKKTKTEDAMDVDEPLVEEASAVVEEDTNTVDETGTEESKANDTGIEEAKTNETEVEESETKEEVVAEESKVNEAEVEDAETKEVVAEEAEVSVE